MKWFKKDKPEKKVETDLTKKGEEPMVENPVTVNVDKEYPYIVQLNDVDGNTTLRKAPFGCKRYIDGANVYLVNEKLGFKEPFPEDSDEFKQYKIDEIETKITKIQNVLDKHKKNKTAKSPEELDMLQDLKVLKGFKRSLELQGKGSYMVISQEHGGRPLYTFDRKGNFKLPVFKNVDYSLLYVPVEADIALAGDLLKLNEDANGDKENPMKLATVVVLVLMVLAFIGLLYFNYKTIQTPQALVEAMGQLSNAQAQITNSLVNVTGNMQEIANQIIVKDPVPTVNPSVQTIQ